MMDKFFNRSPYEVANDLRGMTLSVGEHDAVLQRLTLQFAHENSRWEDRPLFLPGVDAYVAPYRGSHLLFLRTGPEGEHTCVRVDGAEIDGQKLVRPGQICKELGLQDEQTGRVALLGDVVSIAWTNEPQQN